MYLVVFSRFFFHRFCVRGWEKIDGSRWWERGHVRSMGGLANERTTDLRTAHVEAEILVVRKGRDPCVRKVKI